MTAGIVAASAPQEVRWIPLGDLVPSKNNPRKTIDDLKGLAASITQIGIQVPLLVREIGGGFEIIAGHRRYLASKLAKKLDAPCIVREMSDDAAREIMLIENLQREDIPPLEEAEAYEGLLSVLGNTAGVAARVGKPVEHVTRVLQLRKLIPFSRQALAAQLIAIDHALLLAKLADVEQEKALRYVLDCSATRKQKTEDLIAAAIKHIGEDRAYGYWQPQSVLDLKAFIEREIKLELKRAPWDLADAELLPSAGACTGCPKNTVANSALFGDLAIKDAVCTDAVCFNAKRDAFVQIQLEAVARAGTDAVRISWKSTSSKPRALDDAGPRFLEQIFKDGQWIEAEKGSCAHLRTGVSVDFDEQAYGTPDRKKKPGMKLLVCVNPGCKAHRKEWEKPASQKRNAGYDAKAEEEKRGRGERRAAVEAPIREKIWDAILHKLDAAKAIHAVADGLLAATNVRKALLKSFPKMDGATLEAFLIFVDKFSAQCLRVHEYWLRDDKYIQKARAESWALAKRFGVDANAIAAQHFHDEGSIAPDCDALYPKGVPWPKSAEAARPAKKVSSPPRKAPAKAIARSKPAPRAAKKAAAKKAVRK